MSTSVLAAPSATLKSSATISLKTSESTIVEFSLYNDKTLCTVTAYSSLDSPDYTDYIGKVSPESGGSITYQVSAPPKGSGSGSDRHTIYVKFVTDSSMFCGGETYQRSLNFVINYDDSEYQQKLEAEQQRQAQLRKEAEELQAKKTSAQQKVTMAQTEYNDLITMADETNDMINTMNKMNVSTSAYEDELKSATSGLLDAKAEVEKASSRYDSKEYEQSKEYSENSLSIVETANTKVSNIQFNMVKEAQNSVYKKKNVVVSQYNSASKKLESAKVNMNAQEYLTKKESLDKSKAQLDDSIALIDQGDSALESKEYKKALDLYLKTSSGFEEEGSDFALFEFKMVEEQTSFITKIINSIMSFFSNLF